MSSLVREHTDTCVLQVSRGTTISLDHRIPVIATNLTLIKNVTKPERGDPCTERCDGYCHRSNCMYMVESVSNNVIIEN